MVGHGGSQRNFFCTSAKRADRALADYILTHGGCLFPQDPHSKDADERAVGAALLVLAGGPVRRAVPGLPGVLRPGSRQALLPARTQAADRRPTATATRTSN